MFIINSYSFIICRWLRKKLDAWKVMKALSQEKFQHEKFGQLYKIISPPHWDLLLINHTLLTLSRRDDCLIHLENNTLKWNTCCELKIVY